MLNYTNALTVNFKVKDITNKWVQCYYTILTNFTKDDDMDKLVKGYGNISQLDYIEDMSLIVKNLTVMENKA
jgi:phosphopantetheine adenylyltransferase